MVFVYAGPSIGGNYHQIVNNRDISLLSPIKRGDLESLVEKNDPGYIVIADGIFHQYPSVGHQEIREALDLGWKIWGVSSMGAIRAYEMREYGMIGYGRVYQWFVDHPDFTDDEVTLLHLPIYPYQPISEPLINIRFLLEEMVQRNIVSEREAITVIDELKVLYFGHRTLKRFRELLRQKCNSTLSDEKILNFIQIIDSYRIKNIDFINLINQAPWHQ